MPGAASITPRAALISATVPAALSSVKSDTATRAPSRANASAVARLRERKQREEKPFAVMAANLACAARWVDRR